VVSKKCNSRGWVVGSVSYVQILIYLKRVGVTTALTFSNAISGAIGTFMSVLLFDKTNPKGSFEKLMFY